MKYCALQLEKTCRNSTKWQKNAFFIGYFPVLTPNVDSSRKIKRNRPLERVSSPFKRAAMAKIVFAYGYSQYENKNYQIKSCTSERKSDPVKWRNTFLECTRQHHLRVKIAKIRIEEHPTPPPQQPNHIMEIPIAARTAFVLVQYQCCMSFFKVLMNNPFPNLDHCIQQ